MMAPRDHAIKADPLGMLLLGGGVSALVWSAARWQASPTVIPTPSIPASAWVFPVPSLGDRLATISNPFKARVHLGADIMFQRRDARDLIAIFPPGTPNGTPHFFTPDGVPALAVSAGTVSFAAVTAVGRTVIVAHPNHWTTYYTHLSTLAVTKGQAVIAGQTLGTIGASPKDDEHLVHLHFELWAGRKRSRAIDPARYLAAWPRMSIPWSPSSAVGAGTATSLRNARLSAYRPVGSRGEPYPEWLRRLRGESGVYVIREIGGPIVYVGSSVGRLYETLTRHFQVWRRYKGFWRGRFSEGADPGLTYSRSTVEVAIKSTAAADAHDEELRAIRRLQPRDNQLGQPVLEDAPF